MTYLSLYICGLAVIWWIYRLGWVEALKLTVSILIPSALIILFNLKAGRLLFKSPIIGIISVLPTALFIYRGSQPLVLGINSWIERKTDGFVDSKKVVDAEVISKEDA